MSGGGGHIILGDKPLIEQIQMYIDLVADFRRNRAQALIALYRHNEAAITKEDEQFLLRCAADIVDHP